MIKEFSSIFEQGSTEKRGKIENIFPDFFNQLPNQYKFLDDEQYKSVRISMGDEYLDITTKDGNSIGGVNLQKRGAMYYIKNLFIEDEFLSEGYGSLLVELLNYFLRKQHCMGVLDDQHYFKNNKIANSGGSYDTFYEKHGWQLNSYTNLLEFNTGD